jgi:hypothetical protein
MNKALIPPVATEKIPLMLLMRLISAIIEPKGTGPGKRPSTGNAGLFRSPR